jgi:hypothetical protein
MELADLMKEENERNKAIKMDIKQKQRELDVKLANDYIEMRNEQDRKYQEAVQKRSDRVKGFMAIMEGTVVAEESKK